MEQKSYKVTEGGRLDAVLASFASLSRSQLAKQIKAGAVKVNGKEITAPSLKVKEGDEILFEEIVDNCAKVAKPEEEKEIAYVFKDKDIAIINKERGLVVHPAPGHHNDTLVNYLMGEEDFDFDREDSVNFRPGIVHRIDKDTSGLLAVAMNPQAQEILQQEIREGDFDREYLALVYGCVKDKKFRIEAPLTRPNHTERRAIVDVYKGREAITHCTLLANNGKVSLLKCSLETGRTHQIRAHLAYIGYPIVGDSLYGRRKELVALSGQALHAFKLSMIHPATFERMTFYAPLDDYFKKLLLHFYKID